MLLQEQSIEIDQEDLSRLLQEIFLTAVKDYSDLLPPSKRLSAKEPKSFLKDLNFHFLTATTILYDTDWTIELGDLKLDCHTFFSLLADRENIPFAKLKEYAKMLTKTTVGEKIIVLPKVILIDLEPWLIKIDARDSFSLVDKIIYFKKPVITQANLLHRIMNLYKSLGYDLSTERFADVLAVTLKNLED